MKNLEELLEIKNKNYPNVSMREKVTSDSQIKSQILICGGTGCLSGGSVKLQKEFETQLLNHGLEKDVQVVLTGCFGLCEKGPIVIIYPEETFYPQVKLDKVETIVVKHLKDKEIPRELVFKETLTEDSIKGFQEIGFYKKQERIALQNCGKVDPFNIDEYIAFDGYKALNEVITNMTPTEIRTMIKDSGLRGRGGGGFSTGMKWDFAAASENSQKYIICNADEGDPGAFMDRAILEGDPHSVIEAMAIAGFGIGSDQGYVYIRAEYPIAVERLQFAIDQAREKGLLGNNIFGTDFSFDIEIRLGAGAFVCGEETALIASIEGQRGMPRNKPPFPAVRGLWDKPTNVNNVETLAVIPKIVLKGVDWFRSIGTEKSKGTKVFALGGKVNNTGLLEVPMGITLREVIFEIGGGIPNGRSFKAVQTGGPSGGCLTAEHLDTKIDYDNLVSLGSMMGSGGMIVMDDKNCMVDVARFFLEFTVEESCGKCTPCREGTKRLLEILERITEGKGSLEDLDQLESLSYMIKDSSLCGLGQTAPNPVLSTLKHFREEYVAHVTDHHCPAGVCAALTEYFITDKCIGCTKCKRGCPTDCISGDVKQLHVIDQVNCITCGACQKVCPVDAIITR